MNLAKAFEGMKAVKTAGTQASGTRAPGRSGSQALKRPAAGLPLQGTAKRSHPDFAPVKVYLRKETRRAAERKWVDANGGDFSDLVEMLLQKYVGA